MPAPTSSFLRVLPGLAVSGAVAALAMALGAVPTFAHHGLSALTLAILFGISIGNLIPGRWHTPLGPGVGWCKHWLLRTGIVLYGFGLSLQDIADVGLAGVVIDALVVLSTFALACVLGVRWLRLDPRTSMLIGAGSAICGAAAVMAAEPVVRGKSGEVTVAVATVVVFGTIAMLLYPLLYRLNLDWRLIAGGDHGFGMYVGASVHEVAQVLAAARTISETAADTAVITKMVRVMMLAPFLLGLAVWLARGKASITAQGGHRDAIPWFAFGFIGVVVLNSSWPLPSSLSAWINPLDTAILAMAMAALGITTRAGALRQAGLKPLLLALMLFIWLMLGGAAMHACISQWLV